MPANASFMMEEKLFDGDFMRLSKLINSVCGIKMSPQKKTMVQARLQKRLRSLDMATHSEYCKYLFTKEGMKNELANMIDVVTTNKTEFFREPAHFNYLTEKALPELIKERGAGIRRPLKVWSAGCSTGEEPYTLAMVLAEFAESHAGFEYSILATDISTKVLEEAREGIYKLDKADPVPPAMKKKYLLRSKDRESRLVRVVPALRSRVRFERVNLMEEDYKLREGMDVVFFRNVLIYFERSRQEKLINRLSAHLKPGGYMFVGHSETLHGLDVPLTQAASTVYRKIP